MKDSSGLSGIWAQRLLLLLQQCPNPAACRCCTLHAARPSAALLLWPGPLQPLPAASSLSAKLHLPHTGSQPPARAGEPAACLLPPFCSCPWCGHAASCCLAPTSCCCRCCPPSRACSAAPPFSIAGAAPSSAASLLSLAKLPVMRPSPALAAPCRQQRQPSQYYRPTLSAQAGDAPHTPACPTPRLTRVLLSSIFFMADSVVRGYLITECSSRRAWRGALRRMEPQQGQRRSAASSVCRTSNVPVSRCTADQLLSCSCPRAPAATIRRC